MGIDFEHFTPGLSLLGGILIGLAVAVFLTINRRILGMSGILGGLVAMRSGDVLWRVVFLLGMALSVGVAKLFFPDWTNQEAQIQASDLQIVIAGLLVGFGTRLGSGCTSGHGVCGLSRLSLRSLLATISFMLLGMASVYAWLHWMGV